MRKGTESGIIGEAIRKFAATTDVDTLLEGFDGREKVRSGNRVDFSGYRTALETQAQVTAVLTPGQEEIAVQKTLQYLPGSTITRQMLRINRSAPTGTTKMTRSLLQLKNFRTKDGYRLLPVYIELRYGESGNRAEEGVIVFADNDYRKNKKTVNFTVPGKVLNANRTPVRHEENGISIINDGAGDEGKELELRLSDQTRREIALIGEKKGELDYIRDCFLKLTPDVINELVRRAVKRIYDGPLKT